MTPEPPRRKHSRLAQRDYSAPGAYFVTVCAKDRAKIFWRPVGRDDLGAPCVQLTEYGQIVEKHILSMAGAYRSVTVDKYAIMPNHVHILLSIMQSEDDGAPGSSRPTLSQMIGAMKRLTNQEAGKKLWQTSFYDHIVRTGKDYDTKWRYIDDNPAKWAEDKYFLDTEI